MSQRKEFVSPGPVRRCQHESVVSAYWDQPQDCYRWLGRYLEDGDQSLQDLSKRPHQSPNRTSQEYPTQGSYLLDSLDSQTKCNTLIGCCHGKSIQSRHH